MGAIVLRERVSRGRITSRLANLQPCLIGIEAGGSRVSAANLSAEQASERATEAAREADRAEAHAWSLRMEGFGDPAMGRGVKMASLDGTRAQS